MGNCQAAEAATVVIQHPNGRVERMYWSLNAKDVMSSNPGHYVAIVITSVSAKSANVTPVKHLKLLRPDDTLHIGHVYRLVSFEEVLKEFGGKKYSKLSRWIAVQNQGEDGNKGEKMRAGDESSGRGCLDGDGPGPSQPPHEIETPSQVGEECSRPGGRSIGVGRHHRQWRPALHSIAETGSL